MFRFFLDLLYISIYSSSIRKVTIEEASIFIRMEIGGVCYHRAVVWVDNLCSEMHQSNWSGKTFWKSDHTWRRLHWFVSVTQSKCPGILNDSVMQLHDNIRPHITHQTKELMLTFKWKIGTNSHIVQIWLSVTTSFHWNWRNTYLEQNSFQTFMWI